MKTMAIMGLMILGSASVAEAGILVGLPNQEVAAPVNAELGSILELPNPVKTVTPSKYFVITSLGMQGQGDARTFQIKPTKGARPESVTFVLAGGKSLALKLTPAVGADKFYQVSIESKRAVNAQKFLSQELALMKAMLLDDSTGYVREVVDTKVTSIKFDDLDFRLTRTFSAENLTGYVIRARNKGKVQLKIHPSGLAIGKPNRAIIAQADKDSIEPCPFLRTKPECTVTLRLIVRGAKAPEPVLGSLTNTIPPFVKAGTVVEGGSHE